MSTDPTMTVVNITDPQAVDLSRHALIEASAGTGKTYTIENLVVRLLREESDIQLENILLVTFTEKATSELKQRIRQKIEQTLDGEQSLTQADQRKLLACLDEFDNAAITTIHGFCHGLLREFPFETGNLFQQELIDDAPLFESLLREQIRTDWPQRFRKRLHDLLGLSHFSADPDGFVDKVVYLAQRLSGDASRETLIPDPDGMDANALWDAVRMNVLQLKALVGLPPSFSDAYRRLNINKATKNAVLRDLIIPLEQTLAMVDDEGLGLSPIIPWLQTLIPRSAAKASALDRLVPQKWLKAGENLHECPYLKQIKAHLEDLTHLSINLSQVLTVTALDLLRNRARDVKDRNGWISYQDMLTRVADFVTAPESEAGTQKIRHRYRVAFVDEFQDTDDLQWRIFSTLFMHPESDNRLFLIGDPKQAIYGFRGADVYTYLDARQTLMRLAARRQANLYQLNTNWRSLPAMITGFNAIFGRPAWFGDQAGKGPYEIGYSAAGAPPTDQLPFTTCRDRSQRPAFNVVDLSPAGSQGQAKEMLADFICREIRYLVDAAGIRLLSQGGKERPLVFSDIAILVRSQSEFQPVEAGLASGSIPYAYYRLPGLFQCRQAHWLSMVLRAILNPQHLPTLKLALLTPFFDIAPQTLGAWPELPVDHLSQKMVAQWQSDAQKRCWGQLFQSLLETSGMITRHCTDPGWERSETNLRQLFDYLEAAAYANNMDLSDLVAHLDNLRLTGSAAGADVDIHQIEGEGDKVQILTMHVSKGLQFPVVFIAGGLTMHPGGGMVTYHHLDHQDAAQRFRKVVDLTGLTGTAQAQQELLDENKRLYYVALTRARAKLYVPFYPDQRKHAWIGPICRFVSQAMGEAFGSAAADRLPVGWLDASQSTPGAGTGASTRAMAQRIVPAPLSMQPLLPAQGDFRHRKITLESFSSIGRRMDHGHGRSDRSAVFHLIDEIQRDDDEPAAGPVLEPSLVEALSQLPGGTGMGSMFHMIFETIDFQAVMNGPRDILDSADIRLVIESAMARYRIDAKWASIIARVVAQSLRQPIQVNNASFCLGQLSPAQRRHEIEFYFGFSIAPHQEMIVRGYIDLIFQWQDRFYIADWKSNRLPSGYHQDAMAQEMADAGYDLQYQLYSLSTLKWLRQRLGDRFDPQRHFGGVVYLFIRGMNDDEGQGVYHVPGDHLLPVAALERSIKQRITGIRW